MRQDEKKVKCFPVWRKNDASGRDEFKLMSFMQALYYFDPLPYLLVPSTEPSTILDQAALKKPAELSHKRTPHLQQVGDWHWCNTSFRVWDPSPAPHVDLSCMLILHAFISYIKTLSCLFARKRQSLGDRNVGRCLLVLFRLVLLI